MCILSLCFVSLRSATSRYPHAEFDSCHMAFTGVLSETERAESFTKGRVSEKEKKRYVFAIDAFGGVRLSIRENTNSPPKYRNIVTSEREISKRLLPTAQIWGGDRIGKVKPAPVEKSITAARARHTWETGNGRTDNTTRPECLKRTGFAADRTSIHMDECCPTDKRALG